jgi:hypothetical protein
MVALTLGFALLFITAIIGFRYNERGYYPSIGWGFEQFYLFLVAVANAIYFLSVIKLVYDSRKFYN